jgi:hypothetical protein
MSDAPATPETLVVLDPEQAGRAEAAAGQAGEAASVAVEAAMAAQETVAAAEAVAAEAALDARAETIAEHEDTEQWQTAAIGELRTAIFSLAEQQSQMMTLLQTLAPLPEPEPSPPTPPDSSLPPTAESPKEDARPAPPEQPKRRRLRLL